MVVMCKFKINIYYYPFDDSYNRVWLSIILRKLYVETKVQ